MPPTLHHPEALSLNQEAGNIYAARASLPQSGNLAVIQGQLHKAEDFYQRGVREADALYRPLLDRIAD